MEGLNPTLKLVMALREGLEKGESLRQALQIFIQQEPGELSSRVKKWWIVQESGKTAPVDPGLTLAQKATLNLLKRSFQGESVGAGLLLLQNEVTEKCEMQIEEHVQSLPFKCLLPLLFLIFPAYLLVLLGPLVEELLYSIQQ